MPCSNRPDKVQWDRDHYTTVGCYLRLEDAEKVKAYAAERGLSVAALIKMLLWREIEQQ